MLSKNDISFLHSLKQKKFREQHQVFLAEGVKLVEELVHSTYRVREIYSDSALLDYFTCMKGRDPIRLVEVKQSEMERITALSSPSPVLALVEIPASSSRLHDAPTGLVLALDEIRDPGNLGTIIRIADWFGIDRVVCSHGCVDVYNPKVVQATMGSIARVDVTYVDILDYLSENARQGVPIYGTFLQGTNIYHTDLTPQGVIVIGNEANGISAEVDRVITRRISIPSTPHTLPFQNSAESLNASIATAIVCSEFRRRSAV